MCAIICDSVNPSSNLEYFIESRRIDFGTVASMSASRCGYPTNSAILVCSSGVAELWRRGNVSLGFNASTDMDRTWEPNPLRLFLSGGTFVPLHIYGDKEETYLEGEWSAGDDGWCLVCETKRPRMALFASLRARSIVCDGM
ncbi:hypothetical protein Hanom_Chr17g01534131 [Helianthus anomalus]